MGLQHPAVIGREHPGKTLRQCRLSGTGPRLIATGLRALELGVGVIQCGRADKTLALQITGTVKIGLRIAQLRKERAWTQQELAEKLGIAQQTLAHYEVARIRLPASTLPLLSMLFMTPIDDLVGHTQFAKQASKRGPASQLARSIERISQLPKPKQKFVIEMLETVLAQANG